MSNCIQLKTARLKLKYTSEIDNIGFKELLDKVRDMKEAPKDNEGSCVWWFLAKNTRFDKGYVVIDFGYGRSSHTNRDFRATLIVISKFIMKPSLKVAFVASDEYDGYRTWFKEVVDLKNPTWVEICI